MRNRAKASSFALVLTLFVGLPAGCPSNNATPSGTDASSTAQSIDSSTVRSVAEIRKSGKVVIDVFNDKNFFDYVDTNGKYQGYDVYLAERIARDLDVEPEYVPLESVNRVECLKIGKADVALANFTVTKDRTEAADLALPYMKVALGVVSPEKNLIIDVEQLAGKKLIITKGTTAKTYFITNHPETNLVKFDQYTEIYNTLLDGRDDVFSTDNTKVPVQTLQNPGSKVGIESLDNVDTVAPAVQKGSKELLDQLSEEIETPGKENFFCKDFEETLKPVYGNVVAPESLAVRGEEVK